MSTTIRISLFSEPAELPLVYRGLLARLAAVGEVEEVKIQGESRSPRSPSLTSTILQDSEDLARTILPSQEAVVVYLTHRTDSGQLLDLSVMLAGSGFEGGYRVLLDGPLSLRFSYQELAFPLLEALKPVRSSMDQERATEHGAAVIQGSQELMLRACGLLESTPESRGVVHAAMYLETGWPSPVGCSMVFHRAIGEFSRDFARIFLKYRYGIPMTLLLTPGLDLWKAEIIGEQRANTAPSHSFYQQFSEADSLINFLNYLEEEKARELSALSSGEIRDLLEDAASNISEVSCHNFETSGLLLSTHPLGSVWPIYQYIADTNKSSSA